MQISERTEDAVPVVSITGDIDLESSPQLRTFLRAKIAQKTPKLLLDFGGVNYIDSSGLATLIEILHAYIDTAENLCSSLSEASESDGWDDASRIAQDIAGAAGGLGLAALTAAARAFAQKIREGDGVGDLKSAARSVVEEHIRVRRALANLYPELAA